MINFNNFKLGGVTWNIVVDNERTNDLNVLGICEKPKAKITLCDDKISEDIVEQTFYHELTHAILDMLDRGDLSSDEHFTQSFALLLHQFETTKQ